MKVGDYVRTKKFGIRKITFIDEIALECGEYSFETDISIPGFCDFSGEDIIGKSSPNITDLIEVGDYVNGLRVDAIKDGELLNENSYDGWPVTIVSDSDEIETIATKEQMDTSKIDDWLISIIKNMITNKAVITDLGKVKIIRKSDDLKSFNFQISFYKSLFPDILTNEEKSTRWIEENMDD